MTEAEVYEAKAVLCDAEATKHDPASKAGHRLIWKALDCRTMAQHRRRGYGTAWGCRHRYTLRAIAPGRFALRRLRRDGFSHPPGCWTEDGDWLREQIRNGTPTAVTV